MTDNLSVIIPARNEALTLPGSLSALFNSARMASCELEVIVVINRCSDATEQVAKDHGCTVVHSDAKNLAIIRNAGVRAASNEFVATVDADSIVCEEMITNVLRELHKPNVVGGGVMIYPSRYSLGILLTGFMLLPIALWHGISAGFFFFRRKDFDAIYGFNEELVSVEDIDFAKRLRDFGKRDGRRFVTLWRTYITTSTRKFDRFGDWYFLLRPHLLMKLFRGNDTKAANEVWYDFER
ncbi:MAG: glycosyltransferase [Bdellovibrionales bacterium]|nr:glycosyltransferase [Bdellovibrionales bacterium]